MLASESGKPRGAADTPRYDPSRQGASAATVTDAAAYNPAADVTADAPGKKTKVRVLSSNTGMLWMFISAPTILALSCCAAFAACS